VMNTRSMIVMQDAADHAAQGASSSSNATSAVDSAGEKVAIVPELSSSPHTEGNKSPRQSLGQHLFPKIDTKERNEISETPVIIGVPSDVTAVDIIDMLQDDSVIVPAAPSESAAKVSFILQSETL
jgi:hypothetical protein